MVLSTHLIPYWKWATISKILLHISLFLRLIQKNVIIAIIKWMGFFCLIFPLLIWTTSVCLFIAHNTAQINKLNTDSIQKIRLEIAFILIPLHKNLMRQYICCFGLMSPIQILDKVCPNALGKGMNPSVLLPQQQIA